MTSLPKLYFLKKIMNHLCKIVTDRSEMVNIKTWRSECRAAYKTNYINISTMSNIFQNIFLNINSWLSSPDRSSFAMFPQLPLNQVPTY